MTRVVITGLGMMDALGSNVSECFASACSDTVPNTKHPQEWFDPNTTMLEHVVVKGILPHKSPTNLRFKLKEFGLADRDVSRLVVDDQEVTYTILAALASAAITHSSVKGKNVPMFYAKNPRDYHISKLLENAAINSDRISLYHLLSTRPEHVIDQLSIHLNTHGSLFNVSASCMSGMAMMESAINLLQLDDSIEFVIVASSNSHITPHELFYFQQLKAVAPDGICRPFDTSRNGFVAGSGNSCIIVETEKHAKERGAKILAYVDGIGTSCDGQNISSPDVNLIGAELALTKCFKNYQKDSVDYIQAHATGTVAGDVLEAKFISSHFPNSRVSSMKGHLGHHIYNSNLVELGYAILTLNSGIIFPTLNLTSPLQSNLEFITTPTRAPIKHVLKNSFGFGGKNGFMLISSGE